MKTIVGMMLALCFALPVLAGEHGCEYTTQECLDYMASHYRDRGWCGIELASDEETRVMTVTRVVPDSPAAQGGFAVGDVLLGLNGVLFAEASEEDQKAAKAGMKAGAQVTYIVGRDGEHVEVPVTLGAVPEAVLATWIGHHMLDHVQVALSDAE